MAQKFIFVNNATNTLQRVNTDKKYQGKITFLPERYSLVHPKGSPLGGFMKCKNSFNKEFTGPTQL